MEILLPVHDRFLVAFGTDFPFATAGQSALLRYFISIGFHCYDHLEQQLSGLDQ